MKYLPKGYNQLVIESENQTSGLGFLYWTQVFFIYQLIFDVILQRGASYRAKAVKLRVSKIIKKLQNKGFKGKY